VSNSQDDDALLAALHEAVTACGAVPAAFVEAARNAYAWHNIDAELASLAYDSWREPEPAAVRSEAAAVRALTFQSDRFTIEVEVARDALYCQLVPAHPGVAELHTRTGQVITASIDEVGCFILRQVPGEAFRLRCRTEAGAEVRTGWVTL
jgi:hypothetical protein